SETGEIACEATPYDDFELARSELAPPDDFELLSQRYAWRADSSGKHLCAGFTTTGDCVDRVYEFRRDQAHTPSAFRRHFVQCGSDRSNLFIRKPARHFDLRFTLKHDGDIVRCTTPHGIGNPVRNRENRNQN